MELYELKAKAKSLLKELIQTPSYSKQEALSALLIERYLKESGIPFYRKANNVWAKNLHFDPNLPTVLLNSHHDTVRPNSAYTIDPFSALEKDGKIYGLGSNDAGASLVGLWATFLHYYKEKMAYNLIYAASAEEEISGVGGIQSILSELGPISFAIVGEPTEMNLATAEKGLVVFDCTVEGTASHAAHPNDDNSIYNAFKEIEKVRTMEFKKVSPVLGKVKATVTCVNAGSAHNVVPNQTVFTIDVRTNERYSNEEIQELLENSLNAKVKARSLRLQASFIDLEHPIVQSAKRMGCKLYGSPTVSDQALMPFPSVKIGIGDSKRSHSADEYVYEKELFHGIEKYIELFEPLLLGK